MPREINIKPVLNGFICQVGCQQVVFNDVRSLAVTVEEYFNHPEETEKRFIEKAVNRMEPVPCAPPATTAQDCCGQMAQQDNVRSPEPRLRR